MIDYNSDKVCRQVREVSDKVVLSFSMGKDSIAAYNMLKRYWDVKDIYPVFLYMIPGLRFQEEQLSYYEGVFGQRIKRMPNPSLPLQIDANMYQSPDRVDIIFDANMYRHSYDEVFTAAKIDLGLSADTYTAVGVRSADSVMRRASIARHGAINKKRKQFFPVFDWKIADIVSSIRDSKIKLPYDYRIWGKSFDGLDYRFLKGLKQYFPDDYKAVLDYFPFIHLEIERYERYGV
jgi:3'-phosphoadenosine 5'-phosphosulfate sulfotransferase (PAPS reductase)/FAD synthetase